MNSQYNNFKQLMKPLIEGGIREDHPLEIGRRMRLLNFISVIGILNLIPFGISALLLGNSTLGLLDLAVAFVLIINQLHLRTTGNHNFSAYCGIGCAGILFFYLFVSGGIEKSGPLWFYTFPLFASFLLGSKKGAIATFILLCSAILFLSIDPGSQALPTYSLHFKIRFIMSLLVVSLFAYFFESVMKDTQHKLTLNNVELVKVNEHLKQEINESKQAKEALSQAYDELKSTQAQLVQSAKLASIGELASGVAHELNQPLMVIRGNAQVIQRNLRKNNLDNNDLVEQLEPILRNTKRMMNIINHLSTFSRQSQSDFKPVDVNETLEDAFLMLGEQLRLRKIEVKKHFTPDLPKVDADSNQLEQVFLNLITNARDAILQRLEVSGRLEIITRMGEADNHQSQNFIEILVRDNGGGIPSENMEKIFDPFFTTKEVGKGTGLGLSISYGIIKDHQGEISVAETSPAGTTFRIKLPIEDENSILRG